MRSIGAGSKESPLKQSEKHASQMNFTCYLDTSLGLIYIHKLGIMIGRRSHLKWVRIWWGAQGCVLIRINAYAQCAIG